MKLEMDYKSCNNPTRQSIKVYTNDYNKNVLWTLDSKPWFKRTENKEIILYNWFYKARKTNNKLIK